MKLNEFINEVISQVISGIDSANEKLPNHKVSYNEGNVIERDNVEGIKYKIIIKVPITHCVSRYQKVTNVKITT